MQRYLWLVWDIVATLTFVVIGMHAHGHRLALSAVATVWWPFAAGLGVGWLLARSRAGEFWPGGAVVWLTTLGLGMVLRLATHQGVVWLFVAVAGFFLAVFLLTPRLLAAMVVRRRHSGGLTASSR